MCLCVFFCCASDLANTKCGDDTFVDESAVAAVMGLFNCTYSKAVDIWRADRIAANERSNKVLRRQATKTLQYPHVPAKDQDLYASLSDIGRKQYMSELGKTANQSEKPSSKQHKKQMSFAKKEQLRLQKQRRSTMDEDDTESDEMPTLSCDSESDDSEASGFDSEEEFAYRRKGKGKKVVRNQPKDKNSESQPRSKAPPKQATKTLQYPHVPA